MSTAKDHSTRNDPASHGHSAKAGPTTWHCINPRNRAAICPGISRNTPARALKLKVRSSGAKGKGCTCTAAFRLAAWCKASGVSIVHPSPAATIAKIAR